MMILDTKINSVSKNSQANPSISALNDGGFVVVWNTSLSCTEDCNDNSNETGIYAQRFDANGVALGSEVRINTASDYAFNAEISALKDGGYLVSWSSSFFDSEGEIYAQRYDANGVAQGGKFHVNTYSKGAQNNQVFAALNNGDFIAAWQSYTQDGDTQGVYAQRFNANGVMQGSEFRVNTYTDSFQLEPTIAVLNDNGFVVCWTSYYQDGSYGGIYAQRYDENGVMQGNEFRVNSFTYESQFTPEIAALNDGGFVVIWQSYGQDGGNYRQVYAQRFDKNGVMQGSEFRVNTYTDDDHNSPKIAALDDGGFVVCWGTKNQDGGGSDITLNGDSGGIYAQRFDVNGVMQGNEFRVNTYVNGLQELPVIAGLKDGGFVINWESEMQDGDGLGIFAHRYNAIGNEIGWFSIPADRIFNWAENNFSNLFSGHVTSQNIGDYYARLYSNGDALGEKDGNLYFYDGHDINLVGTVTDYLPDAMAAGF